MSNHAAQVPSCITPKYLEKILEDFLEDKSISIKNFQATPGSALDDTWFCQLLRIQVEYTRQNQNEIRSIISKTLLETDLVKKDKKKLILHKVEMKMMSEILPLIYKTLQFKIQSEPFFPYLYKADIGNGLLLMEDLKSDGCVMGDPKSSLDLEHSILVTKTLAQMHTASFLLLQENPDYKNEFLYVFWRRCVEGFPERLVDACYGYFLKYLHLWPISEEDKSIFCSFEGKLMDVMTESYKLRDKSFNALLHGDPWTANMTFKYDDGKLKSVKFIDYQMSNYNSIGLDIVYFIFTSAMEYVIINHLDDIFKVYYDAFTSVAGKIENFTLDTVKNEFFERLEFGFVMATTIRWMIRGDDIFDLDAYWKGKEAPGNDEMFSRKDHISEFVNLLPIFKKHGVFKLQN